MHKLFFWLNWHVGDLVLTRPLVRRVLDTHDVQIVYGCWENQAYLIEDLPIQIVVDPRNDPRRGDLPESLLHLCPPGYVPIYLWIGSYPEIAHHNWATMVEIYNRQVESHGLSELKIRSDWVPMVDFPPLEVTVAHNSVFVENGVARSKHSDFEFDIEALATQFPKLNFYCTFDPKCRKSNVFDCSTYNLKVLSSIGNRCVAIIGKGSGPFCSTLTEVNRYKPRAIMRYHPRDAGNAIWDYPGNPMQYLETDDDVRAFLATVERREILSLVPTVGLASTETTKPAVAPECEVARLDIVINQFERFPSDVDCRQALAEAHERVLQLWRDIPDDDLEYAYRGALGKSTRRLLEMNAWNLIAGRPLYDGLSNSQGSLNLTESPGEELRSLICTMLSVAPTEFQRKIDFKRIPPWLRSDLLGYLHRSDDVWERRGSTDQCFIEYEKLLDNLATTIENESISPYHKHLIKRVIELDRRPNNIASDCDWTSVQQSMGKLYGRLALSSGTNVDFDLPPIDRNRTPRIGLLFADLKRSADTYFSLPLFEYLDPSLDVNVYVLAKEIDPFEYYCLERCPKISHLPNDLIHRVDFLRNEDLDVLIFPPNTTLHPPLGLLGSHRLARYQMSSDHRLTNGLKHIDGMFAEADDRFEAAVTSSNEERIEIASTATCFAMGSIAQATLTPINLSALQIRESDIVFGSMACMRSCHRELLKLWLSILDRVPNSVLLLLPFEHDQGFDRKQAFFNYVQSICREQGVDMNRVRLATPDPYPNFDELPQFLCRVHVVLDPFPISSPGQTISAFRLGLPVVTLCGKYPQTRAATELIGKLSPEIGSLTITDSESDYIAKAVALAKSPELRRRIREETFQKLPTASFIDSQAFGRRLSDVLLDILKGT